MSARWGSWRRDLLFALAGAVVASAVLVPMGWSRVNAERRRAEVAEEAARVERARAESEKAEREKLARAEAELLAIRRQHEQAMLRALLNDGRPTPP